MRLKRIAKWTAGVAAILVVAGAAIFALYFPTIVAPACPSCYGLEKIADRLYVGTDMPQERRDQLQTEITAATKTVAAYLEPTTARPYVVACSTNACDLRVGGGGDEGARAQALTTPYFTVIRIGPRGLNETIITHEFAHTAMHEIAGASAVRNGDFPAWLNEGMAVIISNDERYIRDGETADQRCLEPADAPLPVSPFDWGPQAGKDHSIYARAACAALHWLDDHGGTSGLLAALRKIRETDETFPN